MARLRAVSSGATRVLIAEDEALIRLDLKEMLEEEGYLVVAEVGDGEQAVDRARELAPAIEAFLQQPMGESTPAHEAWAWMQRIVRS
jgi:response regulator NasT